LSSGKYDRKSIAHRSPPTVPFFPYEYILKRLCFQEEKSGKTSVIPPLLLLDEDGTNKKSARTYLH
jgi:hypothetical protein